MGFRIFDDKAAQITDKWVREFENPKNQKGMGWCFAAQGCLPEGVNENDPRVARLVRLAQQYVQDNQR